MLWCLVKTRIIFAVLQGFVESRVPPPRFTQNPFCTQLDTLASAVSQANSSYLHQIKENSCTETGISPTVNSTTRLLWLCCFVTAGIDLHVGVHVLDSSARHPEGPLPRAAGERSQAGITALSKPQGINFLLQRNWIQEPSHDYIS